VVMGGLRRTVSCILVGRPRGRGRGLGTWVGTTTTSAGHTRRGVGVVHSFSAIAQV